MLVYYILFLSCLGSFIHAYAYNYLKPHSIVSKCPCCKHRLSTFDLIPLISYCYLKGRCRYCKWKIPISYLIVELSMILLGLLLYHQKLSFIYLLFSCSLLYLSLVDLRLKIIPDRCHIFHLCILFLFYKSQLHIGFSFCIFLLFSILAYKQLIGFGDVKLLSTFALIFSLNQLLYALSIASISALCTYTFFKEKEIPFAPFLSLGFYICFFL